MTFRLCRHGLVLMRRCTCCRTDHFESPEITDLADLGHARSDWELRHEYCEDYYAVAEDLEDW